MSRQCRVRTACCKPGGGEDAVVGGDRLLPGAAVLPSGRPGGGAGVSMAADEGTGVAGALVCCIAGGEEAGGLVFGADVLMKGG